MKRGAEIEGSIYEWLKKRHPHGPTWFDRDDVPVDAPPIELRMLYAMNVIEYNISNGGWSQFLWNCIDQWRPIVKTAREGYSLIGAADQAAALDALEALCERDERECLTSLGRENGSMETFATFTQRSYLSREDAWEELFWGDIHDRRLAWLEANEPRIRALIGQLDA